MIQPAVFVKVLETTFRNEGWATKDTPCWMVSVCNGDQSFYPTKAFAYGSDGRFLIKPDAVKWAWEVSTMLGGLPVSLYRTTVTTAEQFVEDFE